MGAGQVISQRKLYKHLEVSLCRLLGAFHGKKKKKKF
jgi:hypothetical protein